MARKQLRNRYQDARPELIGKFHWCAYWKHWDEILDCKIVDYSSVWTVRKVGDTRVRNHSTLMEAGLFFDEPRIENGRHLAPIRSSPQEPGGRSLHTG